MSGQTVELDPQVGEYFQQASDGMWLCRRYGHDFRPLMGENEYLKEPLNGTGEVWYQPEMCQRGCDTPARSDYVPYTLERIGHRHIFYRDGYIAQGQHITRQDARLYGYYKADLARKKKEKPRHLRAVAARAAS